MKSVHYGIYHPLMGWFVERVAAVVCRRSVEERGVAVPTSELYMTTMLIQTITTDSAVVRCEQCLRQ